MHLQLLHDSEGFLDHLGNWELVAWCLALGIYLLRFMTVGNKINKKYRNFSVLITEQVWLAAYICSLVYMPGYKVPVLPSMPVHCWRCCFVIPPQGEIMFSLDRLDQ